MLGSVDGWTLGDSDGAVEGKVDGDMLGTTLGDSEGAADGPVDGLTEG